MIGSNLCSALLAAGHHVTAIDNLWRGCRQNFTHTKANRYGDRLRFVLADLSSLGDWCQELQNADCVYHLADIVAGVGYVFDNQASVFRKNLQINSNVATASEIMKVRRYVYVGTACSFPQHLQNSVDGAPLREEDQYPAHPESAYGWSKLMGELDAMYMAASTDINSVVLVLHNVYGTPCDYDSQRAQALPALCHRALRTAAQGGRDLVVWGTGDQGRAFVHVDDVVRALMSALTRGHGQGPIQIGPDKCTPIREAAQLICDLVGQGLEVVFDTSKPTGDIGRRADYSKARRCLDWQPTVDLRDGIKSLIDWIAIKENYD